MNILIKLIRRTAIHHALRYRTKAKEASIICNNAIEWAREAEGTINELKEKNFELRQPDLEQRLWKKAVEEATRNQKEELYASRAALLKLPMLSDRKLRDAVEFEVHKVDDGWAIGESFCQIGGCTGYGYERYKTEHDALECAYIRTCLGEKQTTGGACSECYADYMKSVM